MTTLQIRLGLELGMQKSRSRVDRASKNDIVGSSEMSCVILDTERVEIKDYR